MSTKVLYATLAGFVLGVFVGTITTPSLTTIAWVLIIGVGLALVWRKNSEAILSQSILLISIFVCSFALGLLRIEFAASQFDVSPLATQLGNDVVLTGTVAREPDVRNRSIQLYVDVGEDTLLISTERYAEVAYGDEVIIKGELKKPESFTTDLGRVFDYPQYLRARGVEYQISFAEVSVVRSGQASPVIAWLLMQKQLLVGSIQSAIPEPQAGLGVGLLLGVKQGLGDDLEEDFRRTGIIHIVVLSGYNVMLVVAFVMAVLSIFLPARPRVLFGVLGIVAFALIVGLSATVVRASIMASLFLVAGAYGRTYDVLRALLLAGTVMILINPYLLLYDVGFQLSFMATLGLILVAPRFEVLAATLPNKIGIRDFFIATLATQIAVLPLLLYHIGEISLISIVVNVLVLPMVPLAMLLTFITSVVNLTLPALVVLPATLASLSLTYIIEVAIFFAALPFAAVAVPAFSPVLVPVLYGCMGLALLFRRRKLPDSTLQLTGWVIETEVDTKVGGTQSVPPTTLEPPIFFR
jgi:competence protein ComEC